MSSGELAALITAIGVSLAGIITAIAALRNSNYNATKAKDLEEKIARLETENDRLTADNQLKTAHNEMQDRIILDQAIKIDKWHAWGQSMGRAFNVMQLEYGAMSAHLRKPDKHATGPLTPLPFDNENIQRADD